MPSNYRLEVLLGRFAGRLTEEYDLVDAAVLDYEGQQERLATQVARYWQGGAVVEIGTGTGRTASAILSAVPVSRFIAIDHEPAMLPQARKRLSEHVNSSRVDFRQQDAIKALQCLPRGSVDIVASCFTLHNCERDYRTLVIEAVFRVLRPGGVFINNDKYAADDEEEYIRELSEQMLRYDALLSHGDSELRALWIRHELEDQLPSRIMRTGEAVAELRQVGFVDVSIVSRTGQYGLLVARKSRDME